MTVVYLLFSGPGYYPAGGMLDFKGQFGTVVAAQAAFAASRVEGESDHEWGQIAEVADGKVVPILEWDEDGSHAREWGPFVDWRTVE